MATYSHSKISTFEHCHYKYKLQYIDKIKTEIQNTIEAFMGGIVHQVLEELYKRKANFQDISKQGMINYYNFLWDKEYSEDILIVKKGLTSENYKKMGEKFLSDYYDNYSPFEQLTILGLETQDRLTLPDGNQWHVRIDKFACDSKGNYYVCDYKTNSRMKFQEEADSDRQLAMYSIWVKDKFKDAKSVKLVWHMLAFNKEVVSERTEEQLKKLQEEIVNIIKEIENTKEFPTNVTPLCDYCNFKSICPSFKHEVELEIKKEVSEFKEDDGVKLVDEYANLKKEKKEIEEKEERIKTELVEFAKQKGIDVVYGSNYKASLKEFERIVLPEGEDKEEFIKLMKEKGVYDNCSMICYPKLNSFVLRGNADSQIKEKVRIEKDYRLSLSKKRDAKETE
jgi:putative RecB family exonuclease